MVNGLTKFITATSAETSTEAWNSMRRNKVDADLVLHPERGGYFHRRINYFGQL